MIGQAMETWPDDALRRVVDAPVELWRSEWYLRPDGAACLIGHAFNARALADSCAGVGLWWEAIEQREIEDAFDAACDRFGIPRTVRAIKLRALAILLKRHPLDNRLAVLRAEAAA